MYTVDAEEEENRRKSEEGHVTVPSVGKDDFEIGENSENVEPKLKSDSNDLYSSLSSAEDSRDRKLEMEHQVKARPCIKYCKSKKTGKLLPVRFQGNINVWQ